MVLHYLYLLRFTVEMFLSKLKKNSEEKSIVLIDMDVENPENCSNVCSIQSCAEMKLEHERLTKLFSLQEKELEAKRKELFEKDLLLEQLQQMSDVLKEVVRNNDTELDTTKSELDTVKSQLDLNESSLFELRKSKARVTLDYERCDDELRRSQRELSSVSHEMMVQSEMITDLQRDLALRKRAERELAERCQNSEDENNKLVSNLMEITTQLGASESQRLSLQQLNEDLSTQIFTVSQKNTDLDSQLKDLISQHRKLCDEKIALSEKLEMSEHELHHHRYELKSIKSRHLWVSGKMSELSAVIKERMQSREVMCGGCCFKFPFFGGKKKTTVVRNEKSLAYLDDESYRLAEEVLQEFPSFVL